MNWLDFIIIVMVVWFAFVGVTSGLLRELATLIASLLGVLLAGHFYRQLADDIRIVYDDATMDQLLAFVAIFAATVLAGQIAGGFLRELAQLLMLGPFDRAGGLVFGLLKGCVIVELLLIAFATFPAATWLTSAIAHSLLAPIFLSGVPWLLHLLPNSFSQAVHAF